MNILNQYSYPFIVLALLAAAYILLRHYLRVRWVFVVGTQVVIVAAFTAAFLFLRPGTGNISSTDEAINTLNNGRPTFIEFFSNYCSGCLALNPIVDELVTDIETDYNILRINIHTETGRSLRQELGFSFTPEFVLYDASGQEIWRDHIPPTMNIIDQGVVDLQ